MPVRYTAKTKVCKDCGKRKRCKTSFPFNPWFNTPLARCKVCYRKSRVTYRKKNLKRFLELEKYQRKLYVKKRRAYSNNYYYTHKKQVYKAIIQYHRSFKGKVKKMYLSLQYRSKHTPRYKKLGKYLSRKDFEIWIHKNLETYTKIYNKWKRSGFRQKYAPTIDRIDNSKGYLLNNIQLLTLSDNSRKGNRPNRV